MSFNERSGYAGAPKSSSLSITKIFTLAVVAIVGLFVLVNLFSVFEKVDADEIVVIQAPMSGKLTWHTSAGTKWQGFGKVTSYPKQFSYEGQSNVQFNDGGTATVKASLQIAMPLDAENLTELHTRFGSEEAIESAIVAKVTNKAITMTAPLMTARESFAEKKNYLISYVEDQIAHGVYRTTQREARVKDALTDQEKTIILVEIVKKEDGTPARQEQPILASYGMTPSNFSLDDVNYDDQVKKQIKDQQAITMAVQTSIAEARQAEQRAITVEQSGRANAAEAKWKQEVIKAERVTEGESKLAVARLANEESEQYRQSLLKKADGEATYKKRIMDADGALEQRLNAAVQIATAQAAALAEIKVPIVPQTVFGGGGSDGKSDNVTDLFRILTLQAMEAVGLGKK